MAIVRILLDICFFLDKIRVKFSAERSDFSSLIIHYQIVTLSNDVHLHLKILKITFYFYSCLVTLFLQKLLDPKNMEEECVLITLQPIMISGWKTDTEFVGFKEPPSKLVILCSHSQ